MRKWWLIGTGMLAASLLLAGGVIWYLRETQPDAVSTVVGPERSPVPIDASSSDQGGGVTLGANDTPTPSPGASTKPEDLTAYDKYKQDPHALFQDIRTGNGLETGRTSKVTVNYRGWLTNGQLFDETYQTGKTFSFEMGAGKVITGWEEGLVGMKVGGKRRVIVPPAVGYGAQGRDSIPGNAVLVFDIELVDVK